MRTQHTPGPWHVGGTEHSKCRIYSHEESHAIARTYGPYLDGVPVAELTGPKNVADARLIASAPDLLKALKGLVAICDDADCSHPALDAARAAIRAAIAEGIGREK